MCSGFWSIKLGEVFTAIIAASNVLLAFYIFFFKKKEDAKLRKTIENQTREASRIEWFKLIIVQPNIQLIHDFFSGVDALINRVCPSERLTPDENVELSSEMDTLFNNFDKTFVETLEYLNEATAASIQVSLEKLRDDITDSRSFTSAIGNGDNRKILKAKLREARKFFFRTLYAFTPVAPPK
jgi:hypothetical protein